MAQARPTTRSHISQTLSALSAEAANEAAAAEPTLVGIPAVTVGGAAAEPNKPTPVSVLHLPRSETVKDLPAVSAAAQLKAVSPAAIASELERKVQRALASERAREKALNRSRAALAQAASDFKQALQASDAARKALEAKRVEVEKAMELVRSQEHDRNAARNAREALESLAHYWRRP